MEIENRIISDLGKGVTYGDADGPDIFIPEFGFMVPSFVDPRIDLIPEGSLKRFKRVSYHVPFKMRGFFTALDWPEAFRSGVDWRENDDGFVLCDGDSERADGGKCRSKAVNRTRYCRCHGGGLHPLDKKMSTKNVVAPPAERVVKLNRPQKFMQGFLDISEITDEEIQGMFIYNDDGTKCSSMVLGVKIHQQLAQELHRRMNRFLQTKTASMLNVMVDIAESDLVEPADRIKAAQWVAERTMGKTPDVIIHGKVDAPYEAIFESIDAGSREDYRQKVTSTRLELGGESDQIIDVEVDEQSEDWFYHQDGGGPADQERTDTPDPGTNLESVRRNTENRDELNRQQELKKARAKAKQRRFAARAVGAPLDDMPWLPEWKFCGDGTFRMKLVCPDKQTQARLDRIAVNNDAAFKAAEQWRSDHVA